MTAVKMGTQSPSLPVTSVTPVTGTIDEVDYQIRRSPCHQCDPHHICSSVAMVVEVLTFPQVASSDLKHFFTGALCEYEELRQVQPLPFVFA